MMRLIAVVLVPILLLGFVELALRVLGYGYSTRFFVPLEIEGKDYLIPNRKFTHQFFPPALARSPLPIRMLEQKPEGTYRIFLFGESAAYGDPDPSYGVGRFLEALLETRYPGTDFEVVCVAITAINSHVILPIARDCAEQEGDMWIIYMGNNEMVGPFGAGTVFGEKAPGLMFVRTILAIKSTRIGQLLSELAAAAHGESQAPETWNGIEMFSKNKLAHDDPARLKAYDNFRGNLASILLEGERAGVPVVLSTVASNLKDCSPFFSLNSIPQDDSLLEWGDLFQAGLIHEGEGDFKAALALFNQAASIDPAHAELQYRIGKCHLALGDSEGAIVAFTKARDHDALAVRADTRINSTIREAFDVFQGRNLIGLDAARLMAEEVPDGVSGQETFHEHVHFTVEGNYRLARLMARTVEENLPESFNTSHRTLDTEAEFKACADRLAYSLWDEKRVWDVALQRVAVPPFSSQSCFEQRNFYLEQQMKEVDSRTTRSSLMDVVNVYEAALRRNPDDTLVRWNYAQFLERNRSFAKAIDQGKEICARVPHAPWPHYFVGSLLAKEGRKREAVSFLRMALEIQPDLPFAGEELERILEANPSLR